MNTQGKYALLYRQGLRSEFRDRYDEYGSEYQDILKTGNIKEPEIAATIFTGLSRLFELGDGESVIFESPKIGPKVMAVDKEFGGGVEISRKTIEDDQYGKMKEAARWLAHAARMCVEYRVGGFLDDAFTGTLYKGIDSLSLINSAHTILNPQTSTTTWSNATSNPVQVSVAGLSAMHDIFLTMKDHNGDPIKMMPSKLIIGNNTGDFQRAKQIMLSEKEPFTADNQDSGIRLAMPSLKKLVISRFKTSLKSYFMVDESYNDAWFLTRRAATVEDERDFKTGAYLWKSTMRFLIWFVDPRGWVGANPT